MTTYLEYYNTNLSPKLQEIDLFLKTEEDNIIDINDVSKLLEITKSEIKEIMSVNGLNNITKHSFFIIMLNGSSDICKLFARELQVSIPDYYSISDISYIYQLPYESVLEAAKQASIEDKDITSKNINELFAYIYV
jgi:predicted transcriptional regulator of viral defense system